MGKRRRAKRQEQLHIEQPAEQQDFTAAQGPPLPVRLSCNSQSASVAIAVGSSLRVYDHRYATA